jgi:hypothetical protein
MPKYVFVKNKEVLSSDYNLKDMDGFNFKPKNNVKYDGIKVERATIVNPIFVEAILTRKNNAQLEKYLEYILMVLNDEDAGEDDVVIAMNEIERFRMMLINKHKKYLKDEYVEKMVKRIRILEEELKIKRASYNFEFETQRKSR